MPRFEIQKSGSSANWTGKKVLGLHTGTIDIAGGYIEMGDAQLSTGEVLIDMETIAVTDIEDPTVNNEFLSHLRHSDFFDVSSFRTSTLRVTDATHLQDARYKVNGLLTIKDMTHPVTFVATVEVFTDFLHSLGEIIVDRTLYDIRYGSGRFLKNLGDKLIYDEFVLQFKLIAKKVQ